MSDSIIPEKIQEIVSDVEEKAVDEIVQTEETVEAVAEAPVEAPEVAETPAEVPAAEAPVEAPEVAEAPAETAVEAEAPEVAETPAETAEAPATETAAETAEAEAEVPATEAAETAEEAAEEEAAIDLTEKTLPELSELFEKLKSSPDSMQRSKEAEGIKSAFYKLLLKLKGENPEEASVEVNNPFEAVEQNFKALYADYKKERAEFNKQQEAQREENLKTKLAIVEELKSLVEKEDEVSSSFPALRDIQNRWRDAGPVPASAYRDLNDTYQFYIEKFYDMVKINRDLRDLDFKKNLEVKTAFCEAAEKLAENENIVNAFHELQKLHEQWKEYGPVAKEVRDDIWNRFKAATAVINKKYQAHFEGIKDQQEANLAAKTELCEQVEAIADKETISASEWNTLSKEIEEIQAKWKSIGFATKKENQKIYDRFRAACDKFFGRKREYYNEFKDSMNDNLAKKMSLIEQAEALKDSTEWKKATDQFISLQKQWKEIGAVPRKKSEQIWKRFRAACDEFFANRDANAKPENDFYGNLKAKKKLIEEIEAYVPVEGQSADEAMKAFAARWQEIGHVPFKEKENVMNAYREAMQQKFPGFSQRPATGRAGNAPKAPRSHKETLIDKYRSLQQDITTYENNIGFFSASKNSQPLIAQMQARIDQAKAELKELELKIRQSEENAE